MTKKIDLSVYCQNVWNSTPLNRTALQRDLIFERDADVCFFQECGPKTIRAGEEALPPMLAARYDEVPTEVGDLNYTPVFYKRDRFDLIDHGYLLYRGKNDANSKSVTWAVLSEKESGVRFGVCSTHFWWRYNEPDDNTWRLSNAAELFDCVTDIQNRYDVPVIVGGDLNCGKCSSQGEEPWLWLCERLTDVRVAAPITTDMMTHHAYPVKDDEVMAVNENGVCISPNDVPGFDKDQYMPDSLKDENGKAYAYRDEMGNYYELNFGLSY